MWLCGPPRTISASDDYREETPIPFDIALVADVNDEFFFVPHPGVSRLPRSRTPVGSMG